MTLSTIAVHLDHTERCEARTLLAVRLARQHGSHLLGLVPTGVPSEAAFAQTGDAVSLVAAAALYQRRRAEAVAHVFRCRLRETGPLPCEIRLADGDPVEAVLAHGHASDLVVVGQADRQAAVDARARQLPEEIMLHAGRAVLIVPRAGRFEGALSRILVAWDGGREAALSVSGALPLLRAANTVTVVSMREDGGADSAGTPSAGELDGWLLRHGIRAAFDCSAVAGRTGDALLAHASARKADLIVMGALGTPGRESGSWAASRTTFLRALPSPSSWPIEAKPARQMRPSSVACFLSVPAVRGACFMASTVRADASAAAVAALRVAMDSGRQTFVLDIPPGFQADVLAGRAPAAQLNVDATPMSQAFTGSAYIQQMVAAEVAEFAQRFRGDPVLPAELAMRMRFNPNLEAAWFGSLSELINNVTMLSIILTGAALIREREHGTIEHLLVMPVTPAEIVLAKIWSMGLVVMVAVGVALAVVVRGALRVPVEGSIALFMAATALHLFATTSMGIFMATVARSMPQFGMLLVLVLVPLQMLSEAARRARACPRLSRR